MNNPYGNRLFMPPPPPRMQQRQQSYEEDPALVATVVQFFQQTQAEGRSMTEVQQTIRESQRIIDKSEPASGLCTKLIWVALVAVLGLCLAIIFKTLFAGKMGAK